MRSHYPKWLALAAALASAAVFHAQELPVTVNLAWLPVTDAERAMSAPVVDKDAGVEALFWRVHVMDELQGQDLQRVLYHYVRLKVFNEKGKESASTVEISYDESTGIQSISGRTIKSDGTILELKRDAIHDREALRAGKLRRKVKSFAMPGVEPGSIVEYRWKEIRDDPRVMYARLQMQREFPVQKVTYFLKPLSGDYTVYRMFTLAFNCKPSKLKVENDGFNSTTLENVPAFKDEPFMPGEPNVRPWVLLLYRDDNKREPAKYWNDIGKEIYRVRLKPALKINDDIRRAAAAAVEGASGDEQKVTALIRYVRKNLRGLFDPGVTEAERARVLGSMPKERLRTSEEVFKSGIGTPNELNTLFAAMASTVGLDARPALVADAEDVVFDPLMADSYFLPSVDMAVKVGGKWKLFDVSTRLLASDMVSWREEGMKALVSDPKKPEFIDTLLSPAEASATVRTGKFELGDNGALQGEVTEEYTGHEAHALRVGLDGDAEAKRIEDLKARIAKVFPGAEVSAASIENAADPDQPLRYKYNVRIENYAQRTGKRLLLQPFFFQRGSTPLFAATERTHPIQFPHAWKEQDRVTITVPPGFDLDHAEAPGPILFGKPGGYEPRLFTKGRDIVAERLFTFGSNGMLFFLKDLYPKLKAAFEEIHRRDGHVVSLKRGTE